jgi:hypothetical protein
MIQTNIERIVCGDPRDPSSTRDLVGISTEEFKHLLLAIKGGIREAELLPLLDDGQLVSIVDRAEMVNAQFGMPPLLDAPVDPPGMRGYFVERIGYLRSLLVKFEAAGEDSVCGIVPKEFEHLITSIQAGCREAVVFSGFSNGAIGMGIAAVKVVYRQAGLAEWDVFDEFLGEDAKGFFEQRFFVLEAVLKVVNLPYFGSAIP